MARAVLLANTIIITKSSGGRSDPTEARVVATTTLQNLIRKHLRSQILSLADLRAVFQTVGLLSEEDVAVVV